jgi:hypothetical protein
MPTLKSGEVKRFHRILGRAINPAEVNRKMESGKTRDIVCRMYAEGDEYGIVELFNNCFERKMTLEEWKWKYKGRGDLKIYSIVLEDKEEGIVGHYGVTPLRMILNGKMIKGVSAADTMIHPKFRSFVRFKNMVRLIMEEMVRDSIVMFYGFSPRQVVRLSVDRLGIYESVENIYEAAKSVRFNSGAARYLYKLSPVSFDDDRIDKLWEDSRDQFRLAIIRDRAFFKWRCGENPLFRYEAWGFTRRWSKKLMGLAVLRRQQTDKVLVTDLVFQRGLLPALLTKVENLAVSAGAKNLSLWLPQQFHDLLRARGFTLADSGATMVKPTHPLAITKDEIREKFFYTMGDTDFL